MRVTHEEVELAVLDALEQAGATTGEIDAATPIAKLRLCDAEFEDLAADLEAEFHVAMAADELRRAEVVKDIVEVVHARAVRIHQVLDKSGSDSYPRRDPRNGG